MRCPISEAKKRAILCVLGEGDIVRLLYFAALLKHGADPNTKNSEPDSADDGRTALTYASQMGHLEVATLLLSYGADPNIKSVISNHNKDDDGQVALIYASRQGYSNIVRLLLSHDADINSKTELGETALSCAASRNDIDIVNIFLNGVSTNKDIDIKN